MEHGPTHSHSGDRIHIRRRGERSVRDLAVAQLQRRKPKADDLAAASVGRNADDLVRDLQRDPFGDKFVRHGGDPCGKLRDASARSHVRQVSGSARLDLHELPDFGDLHLPAVLVDGIALGKRDLRGFRGGYSRKHHHERPGAVRGDRKSTRLNSSHIQKSRMPSSA